MICNFILLQPDDKNNKWKKEIIAVDDGGPNYFIVIYNVKTKEYCDIVINK